MCPFNSCINVIPFVCILFFLSYCFSKNIENTQYSKLQWKYTQVSLNYGPDGLFEKERKKEKMSSSY